MRRLAAVLVPVFLVLAACGNRPAPAAGGDTLVDWPTFHLTTARSGWAAAGPTGPLTQQWSKTLTGAVYGEPLVVGDTLVVATEENHVYGLDARTGAVRWDTTLGTPQPKSGLPCGNIDPLGITGTPAYDASTGSVFAVAETTGGNHTLWALDVTTGATRWNRNLDTQTSRNKLAEQQRTSALVVGDRVITTFGGLAGDCGNYVGYVTSTPTSGVGTIHSYAVPTAREAGIWATPGAVLGRDGNIYVTTGNGAATSGTWDKSDSVTELTPDTLVRKSIFAPASWADDNARDLDLGSMSPTLVPAVNRIVIAGKRGTVYLLNPKLGGVGSAITRISGCHSFGGAARARTTVLMPCKFPLGIRALKVGSSSLKWSWTRSGIYSSPVIAGDKVYVADQSSDDLMVLRLSDGSLIERHHIGNFTHFPSQIVSGDWVFVPSMDGVTAFKGS